MIFLVPLQIDPFWRSSEMVFILLLLLFFSENISICHFVQNSLYINADSDYYVIINNAYLIEPLQ